METDRVRIVAVSHHKRRPGYWRPRLSASWQFPVLAAELRPFMPAIATRNGLLPAALVAWPLKEMSTAPDEICCPYKRGIDNRLSAVSTSRGTDRQGGALEARVRRVAREEMGMRKWIVWTVTVVVWVVLMLLMWASMIGVNMGAVCGRVLAPWAYSLEALLFLPTIWLTRPLDVYWQTKGYGLSILIGSIVETLVLATLYSWLVHVLLRRTLLDSVGRFLRRFRWGLVGLVCAMGAGAIWARTSLAREDHGAPLKHDAEKVNLTVRKPETRPDVRIRLGESRSFPLAEGADGWSVLAREGASPLAIDVASEVIREPKFSMKNRLLFSTISSSGLSSSREVALPDALSDLKLEVRCASGNASGVLALLGCSLGRGGDLLAINFAGREPTAVRGPVELESASALIGRDATYFVGFWWEGKGVRTDRTRTLEYESRSPRGANLAIVRMAGGVTELVADARRFSEHETNNLAAAMTPDGVIHVVGTEVAVSHENSSRVHHLAFDPKAGKWVAHEILAVRTGFTSESTPRVTAQGARVDAYWSVDAGQRSLPEDGLWARRIGEAETWHLLEKSGSFMVLPNADGEGGDLVASPVERFEGGRVRWLFRKGAEWLDLGETDAGAKLYASSISGTEPFSLWRGDRPGLVHACFRAEGRLVVLDLELPGEGSK